MGRPATLADDTHDRWEARAIHISAAIFTRGFFFFLQALRARRQFQNPLEIHC